MKKQIEERDGQLQELENVQREDYGLIEQKSLMSQLQDQQEQMKKVVI